MFIISVRVLLIPLGSRSGFGFIVVLSHSIVTLGSSIGLMARYFRISFNL